MSVGLSERPGDASEPRSNLSIALRHGPRRAEARDGPLSAHGSHPKQESGPSTSLRKDPRYGDDLRAPARGRRSGRSRTLGGDRIVGFGHRSVVVSAENLIIFGDNPDRVRAEAAFAKLCGVAPVPASSGMITLDQLAWNGHRQANAALHRTAIVRMQHHQPTKDYVTKRTFEGRQSATPSAA